jgi:Holliday junction resolvase
MSKGSRREREFVELAQQAGMATYRPATVQYGENDVFGLFDVIAVSPSHSRVIAVQVKSNGARGIEAWTRHTALWRRLGWRTMYAVPYDNVGWRIVECVGEGGDSALVDRVDERDEGGCVGEGVVGFLESEKV